MFAYGRVLAHRSVVVVGQWAGERVLVQIPIRLDKGLPLLGNYPSPATFDPME